MLPNQNVRDDAKYAMKPSRKFDILTIVMRPLIEWLYDVAQTLVYSGKVL